MRNSCPGKFILMMLIFNLIACSGMGFGGKGGSGTFNMSPTISGFSNQSPVVGSIVGPIAFTISDVQTPAEELVLSASSGNHVLLDPLGIVFGGSGSARTLTLIPVTGQIGVANVVITVTDAGGASASAYFVLTVSLDGPDDSEFPAPVARTGQTLSYVTGDDGQVQSGEELPAPRFTDNGDGTVTDNATSLIWLKNANAFGRRNWVNALTDCSALANGMHGLSDGSSAGDWRLPNIRELRSLIDHGQGSGPSTLSLPAGHPFTAAQAKTAVNDEYYWSGTTNSGNTVRAFPMDLFGSVGNDSKTLTYFLWPVRGGSATASIPVPATGQTASYAPGDDGDSQKGVLWPSSRFVDHSDGTVTDTLTGLMWHQNPNAASTPLVWTEAVVFCNDLTHAGHADWRLPSIRELESLIDYGQTERPWPAGAPFTPVVLTIAARHWSSTSVAGYTDIRAWSVDFRYYGSGGALSKTSPGCVWPVRSVTGPMTTMSNN